MMQERTHKSKKIIAWIMTSMVFISSMGFSMDMHFCQDSIRSISLLDDAHTCEGERMSCDMSTQEMPNEQVKVFKQLCCYGEKISLEGLDFESGKAIGKISINKKLLSDAIVVRSLSLKEKQPFVTDIILKDYAFYDPLQLEKKDILVFYQQFLI